MVSTFGVPSNVEELNNLETFKNIKKKYGWMADFMKATLISTSSPIIAMYMCIAFLNQLIRRCGIFPFSVKLDKAKGEHKLWVTRNAMAQIVEFKRWDHAKVRAGGAKDGRLARSEAKRQQHIADHWS